MSNLISKENVLAQMKNYYDDCAQTSEYTRLGFETAMEVVKAEPSADILEHARAIKEYCTKRGNCTGCPLASKDQMYLCAVSHDLPDIWDLPKGDKAE